MIITETENEQLMLCHKLLNSSSSDNYNAKDGAFIDVKREYLGISMERLPEILDKNDFLKKLKSQKEDMDD